MNKEEIGKILDRHTDHQSSKADQGFLESWYNQLEAKNAEEYLLEERIEDSMLVWNKLLGKESIKKVRLWPRMVIAASLLIAIGTGAYLYVLTKRSVESIQFSSTIKPGGNHAYLTLADGKKILLDDAVSGKLAEQSGIIITKSDDGMLSYTFMGNPEKSLKTISYNTVSTPKGGKYRVKLPDGTEVWLNAASSIKFPASFAGMQNRSVALSGEAYFEVAKDKQHPFLVNTAFQQIQVLGTHFNVNAYGDEPISQTTLLEGSVKISAGDAITENAVIMHPGQQATTRENKTTLKLAEVENAIDWKNDEFYFKDMDFKTAMRKIARWYDIEVIYAPGVDTSFEPGGWISRNSSISSVLKMMESTGAVHFKAEGRRITVTK